MPIWEIYNLINQTQSIFPNCHNRDDRDFLYIHLLQWFFIMHAIANPYESQNTLQGIALQPEKVKQRAAEVAWMIIKQSTSYWPENKILWFRSPVLPQYLRALLPSAPYCNGDAPLI